MEKDTNLGAFLKAIRERNQKSQKQIAKELKCSQPLVSHWEGGRKKIPFGRINEVAKVYGMTDDEKKRLAEFMSYVRLVESEPSGYQAFYGLISLPKEIREKVIRAVRAYASAEEE